MKRIAVFVSPHGFGHAARSASIMAAIWELDRSTQFDIFTTIPARFFASSDTFPFNYHSLVTDIGLVQRDPFHEDLPETLRRLDDLIPFEPSLIAGVAEQLGRLKADLVLCDIAPMGILVAKEAGVPSVLIENFTWDWIYRGFTENADELNPYIDYLGRIFASAQYRVQTQPICDPYPAADLVAGPASRKVRTSRTEIRQRLNLTEEHIVAMITTGGVAKNYGFLRKLNDDQQHHFLIPGASTAVAIQDNLILLPTYSEFFHPDLVNASDVIIGKAGYSTIAEVYYAGLPFGFVSRPTYPEHGPLADFIGNEMSGVVIEETEFQSGDFALHLEHLLDMPRIQRSEPNGAEQIAEFLMDLLEP